ncbi:HNH endonuclease [Consotaella salsifontis]|uniref:HNH endonuclease n=1 Tax=Consotaella salsifontis TaxID=1365950 RepID=A0A1T4SDJ9_9HYPH|nr:HNH endonuclease [Consotaella salsifontis]SKA26370.1 HNH endonuclease [Consotaella salsifontis]
MPSRAPRACGLCGGVHAHGERCPKAEARHKERKALSDKKRPSAKARGYTAEWARESKRFLAVFSSCRRCGAPATLVDHIKPHKGDKALFWDRRNWQPLCTSCHSGAKQSQERLSSKGA